MEQKLIKTLYAEYIQAPFLGENRSGWKPFGDYVLIRPDIIAKKSSGGIELPDDLAERMQLAALTGVIIENGEMAFRWNADRTRLHEGYKPQPGDRITFEKYSGKPFNGDDGNHYRLIPDKDVCGLKDLAPFVRFEEKNS